MDTIQRETVFHKKRKCTGITTSNSTSDAYIKYRTWSGHLYFTPMWPFIKLSNILNRLKGRTLLTSNIVRRKARPNCNRSVKEYARCAQEPQRMNVLTDNESTANFRIRLKSLAPFPRKYYQLSPINYACYWYSHPVSEKGNILLTWLKLEFGLNQSFGFMYKGIKIDMASYLSQVSINTFVPIKF